MFEQSGRRGMSCMLLTLCILTVGGTAMGEAYTLMGNVSSYEKDGYNITFNCANGKVRLSFLTEDLLRVHMAPADKEFPKDDLHLDQNGPYAVVTYTWPGAAYKISEGFDADLEGMVYNIRAGKLLVKVRKQPLKLAFYEAGGNLLVMEKEGIVNAGLGYAGSKVYETMQLSDDEHFFGFGAHNHALDMRGHEMTCYAKELETEKWIGGFPVPFFFSSRGYGIFFNNLDDDVTLKMGTTPGEYSFEGTSGGMEGWDMDYYVIYGPRFGDVLKRYTDIVGKPPLPEKWLFGHIQCKCCDWTDKDIIDVTKRYREGSWPCDVIIIDCQGLDKGFKWSSLYPDPDGMYEALNKMGMKTTLSTALFKDIYDWKTYDPTVKAVCQKYWALHVPLVKQGNALWWHDNSERFYNYSGIKTFANGYEAHELFGSLWAKNVVEGMESLGLYGRPVISRGGPIGGHRYIIPFAGDLPHGLKYIRTDLSWLRNGGLSLYSFCLVELGGFIDRGREWMNPLEEHNVIRRMINLVPVVPICRAHGTGELGAMLPWQLTAAQQDLYRYYLKLRYRLHPYLYSGAIEAHKTGRPPLAALAFDYQDDTNTYEKDYEFMLGRQILVAPVLEKVDKWNVYLPKGRWVHYWTGKKYEGGQTVTVDAPLYGKDGLPMFVKAGAIIPMMPEMSYIYEKTPAPITLDVYPDEGISSSYTMYDCETVRSLVRETKFECSEDVTKIDISIGKSAAAYELWVHDEAEPASVEVDCKKLAKMKCKSEYDAAKEGWYYGAGFFYGSDSIKTINIKTAKSSKPHVIRISKRLSTDLNLHNEWRRVAGKDGWKEYAKNPVIKPGKKGQWDCWAVMSMSAVKVGDVFHLYYEGGLTGCGDLQIGHAASTDGLNWIKDPANPVLRPGKKGEWDEGATWDPFVLYEDGLFKMWYGGESAGHRDFQCGYATSRDGTHFTKRGKISNFRGGEMADMHVFHDTKVGRYYMYYWDRRFKKADRLRLAQSPNETDFDFDSAVPIAIEAEQAGHRYTHVFRDNHTWYMYYGFEGKPRSGYATSSAGRHWVARNTNLMGTEDAEILKVEDNLYFMFYCPEGFQDEAGCDIRLAIFDGDLDELASRD